MSAEERCRLAELLRRDLAGEPSVAPTITGDLAPLSHGALRRLACDAILDPITLGPEQRRDPRILLCHQHHHDHHDRKLDLPHHDGRWLTQQGWAHAPP